MVKITFLGGCREVGRSSVLIESKSKDKCVLDYGIRFKGEDRLPLDFDKKNLKAIALTHSHIDHSGAIPFLYKNSSAPLFTNPVSLMISKILINDMIRISNYSYPFGFREFNKTMENHYFLEDGRRQKIGENFYITFIDAGHIPGSVSIIVEVDNKKILYTGDINNQKTNLVNPTNSLKIPEIDVLITESTYALRNHPSRQKIEKDFVDNVINIIENNNGRVLIPAFGVARSQEVLLILKKYNYRGKLFIDGLARKITKLLLDYPEALKNIKFYREALKNTQFISKKSRSKVKKSTGVIIAPSGMLKGGAALGFINSFLNDPLSAIYLVGYQVEGSPGRELLENGVLIFRELENNKQIVKEFKIKAKCEYNYFDFSSHADGDHLHHYIDSIKFNNNSNNIFCVHGDPKATTTLANELVKKSYLSLAPEIGETYSI